MSGETRGSVALVARVAAQKLDERLRKALASGRGDAPHRVFRSTIGKKHPWPLTPCAKQETSDAGVRVEVDETIWCRSSECCMIGRRRTARLWLCG
jgi:hypothetical protein